MVSSHQAVIPRVHWSGFMGTAQSVYEKQEPEERDVVGQVKRLQVEKLTEQPARIGNVEDEALDDLYDMLQRVDTLNQ